MTSRWSVIAGLTLLVMTSAPSRAQSLARILACADIPRADERLQCYDAAARGALGLSSQAAAPTAAQSPALNAQRDALEARERKLLEREQALAAQEKALRSASAGPAATAAQSSNSGDELKQREAALAQREAALASREAAATGTKPAATDDENVTLFGIPIPFTSRDKFNQAENLPNQRVLRDDAGNVEAIEAAVKEWSMSSTGKVTFVLANGQVWQQTDGQTPSLSSNPNKPDHVKISRGAMGSFVLTVNGLNRTIRVRRIDSPQRGR